MLPEPSYPDAKSASSFRDGIEYQDFVCTELAKRHVVLQNLQSRRYQFDVGENLQGFEIKFDGRCTETGRLSIEVAEKTRNDPARDWTHSGIMRNDNSWLYLQGNYQVLFIFAKRFLLNYFSAAHPKVEEKRGTIKTFYLPFDTARKHAANVIEFTNN